jgi:DNA end-binding protein Ku
MATSHAIWKGAISFGLVHIPVSLHSAARESGVDFDWLDKRSMDRVGYKRVNKRTGQEIDKADIVKGVAADKEGSYVVLSDEEIASAYPRATQTIEIEAFVPAGEIPFVYLDRPYYLAPTAKGAKVYALLREALLASGRVGLARVVIQSKQHLAALVPSGPALVLDLLRWGDDIRTWEDLGLPEAGPQAAGITEREMKMARELIADMSTHWDASRYHDGFTQAVMELVHRKAEAGNTEQVAALEEETPAGKGAEIVDLAELLQRSLKGGKAVAGQAGASKPRAPANAAPKRRRA